MLYLEKLKKAARGIIHILFCTSLLASIVIFPVYGTENPAEEYKSDTIVYMKLSEKLKGDGEGNYNLDNAVTREEFAVLLDRVAKLEDISNTLSFSDNSDISEWAEQAIQNGLYYGYISGYPTGDFRPKNDVTYGEAVKMALVAKDKEKASLEFPDEFIKDAEYSGMLYGVFGDTNEPISRGDATVLLHNIFPGNVINLNEQIKPVNKEISPIQASHEETYDGYKLDFDGDGLFEYVTIEPYIFIKNGLYISIYDSARDDCWYEATSHTYRTTPLKYAGDIYEILRDTSTGIYYLKEKTNSQTKYYKFSRPYFEEIKLENEKGLESIAVYDYQEMLENEPPIEKVTDVFDR